MVTMIMMANDRDQDVKNMTPNPATSPAQRARVLKMTMKMIMMTNDDK